jgi:mono/diheme cytochrome c family protein
MNAALKALPMLTFAVGLMSVGSYSARAQVIPPPHFVQQDGEAIFKTVCQGCHMPDAKGAVGAGRYPALAGNSKLKVAVYPVIVVINGQKAMPAFGASFDDVQIANIVNSVRTHFGNSYTDKVTAESVKAARSAFARDTAQH